MTHLRFALAQIDTCVGDLDGNADKIMHYAHLAAHEGAHVVIFPEVTLTGYPIEDLALRRTFRKAAWDKANWLATELEAQPRRGSTAYRAATARRPRRRRPGSMMGRWAAFP